MRAQLPNNRVEIVGNSFNKDSNRISIQLKVHASNKIKIEEPQGHPLVLESDAHQP